MEIIDSEREKNILERIEWWLTANALKIIIEAVSRQKLNTQN